jgi:uncharacterized protein YjiS (DUF1127 family)
MTSTHHDFDFGSWCARHVAWTSAHGVLASKGLYEAAPHRGAQTDGWRAFTRFMDRVLSWEERDRQRRALLRLDDHLLRDIGVSRGAAEEEGRKAFWRP